MPEKPTTIADPFVYWKAFDDSELCPESPSTGEYHDPDISFLHEVRQLTKERYTPGARTGMQSTEQLGVVLQVLSGKHANNEATTSGRKTKNVSVRGTRPWWEEITTMQGKASPLRAVVRTFCNQILPWPANIKDQARIDAHPEFVALDPKLDQEAEIKPGTPVLVKFHNTNDDQHGVITKILPTREPTMVDIMPATKNNFKPKCESPLSVAGAAGGNYVAKTVSTINFGPLARKVRNKIPMGVYGNGTVQTKTHFVASLLAAVGTSGVKGIAGPASSYKNAFIWVGHLKNNGYMDHYDRPKDLGRETIIYAPKYLDVDAPIDVVYYLHDKAGFGMAWVHGPTTSPDQARETAIVEGNDFLDVVAPAIKNLTLSGRNYILIIPEMMHSRGFGTLPGSSARTAKTSSLGDMNQGADVQRTRPEVEANKEALASHKIDVDTTSYSVSSEDPRADTLSGNTRFKEREFSTFDGSFTGGNFVDFHTEVSTVLIKHLNLATSQLKVTDITADGMSVLTVCAMVSLTQNPLTTISPSRVNFIADNYDYASYLPVFSGAPSTTFYKEHFKNASAVSLNYVTRYVATNTIPNPFFVEIGRELYWKGGYQAGSTGEVFKFNDGGPNKIISLHLNDSPAFYALSNAWEDARSVRVSLPRLLSSEIPDHASKIAIKKTSAAMLESLTIIKQEQEKSKTFEEFLNFISNKSSDQICLSDKWKVFCKTTGPKSKKILEQGSKSALQKSYEVYIKAQREIKKQELSMEYDSNLLSLERSKDGLKLKQEKDKAKQEIQVYKNATKQKQIKVNMSGVKIFILDVWGESPEKNLQTKSTYFSVLQESIKLETLERHLKNIEDLEKRMKPSVKKPSDPACARPAESLASLKSTSVPGAFSSNASIGCGPVSLPNPAPSTFSELGQILSFYPKPQDIQNNKIESVNGYELSGFAHLTRKSNNAISKMNSANYGTRMWSCLVPILEKSWERACVASKYIPFRASYGYDKKARKGMLGVNKISLHNLGLAMDVDTPLNPSGNDVTHGVFTNSWKYGIGNNAAIDSFGVFSSTSEELRDNVYEYSFWDGDSLRTTDDWDDAPGAHEDDDLGEYLEDFHNGTVVNPLSSNPLLWVLVFCETSGMKWANSTFMIKRYRGGTGGTQSEKVTLDSIFEINNVVDRVQAISWNTGGPSRLNDHMHFQWWSGKPITFKDVKEAARINGAEY